MNLINNAVSFSPQNISMLVVVFAAIAWIILLMILLSDVYVAPMKKIWKAVWILILIGLPVVGSVLYSSLSIISCVTAKRS